MMDRTKGFVAAFLIALAGTQVASANPTASTSESAALICAKLPPLWHGFLCLAASQYKQAIAICNEVLHDDPGNQRAYVLRGYAHLLKKNEDRQAITDFTEAIRRDPDNAAIHGARAQAYESAKDYDRAIADCTKAVRIDPSYGAAYAWRAACYLKKRVPNKAIADYSLALRHAPSLAWARCGRAEAYRCRSESARALADLEDVLRDDPENEQALSYRCFVYLMNLQDCDRALAESSELIRRNPREPMWYMLRGQAYLVSEEITKALRDWTTAGMLKPGSLHLYCRRKNHSLFLGYYFGTSGDPVPGEDDADERIDACTKRLASDPDNVAAYYERAYTYIGKRVYKRAAADFGEIIRLDPSDAEAFRGRGNCQDHLKAYTDALHDFAEAIRLDPGKADFYAGRARVYGAMGKYEDARQDCAESLRLDPRYVFAYDLRAWVYEACKKYDLAIADYTEAIRLSPVDPVWYERRADARWSIWDYAGAIADYKQAIKLDPGSAHTRAKLAGFLCSCPDAHLRDGNEARKLATAACEAASWRDWYSLESLALACAECGDFDAAVKWETKAGELAPDSAKQSNRERLELFRAHKPYHAPPPSEVSASPSSK